MRIKINGRVSYACNKDDGNFHLPTSSVFDYTELYNEENEPYDCEMPKSAEIIPFSDIIQSIFAFLKINDERVYAQPEADRVEICDVLREMLYAEMLKLAAEHHDLVKRSLELLGSIDNYEKKYEA